MDKFKVLKDYYYQSPDLMSNNLIAEVKLSHFKDKDLIEDIKALNVIELDNIESFYSYCNWDHFLIFKVENDYYFCYTELVPSFDKAALLKILDYNLYLRKDKIDRISK